MKLPLSVKKNLCFHTYGITPHEAQYEKSTSPFKVVKSEVLAHRIRKFELLEICRLYIS